MSNPERSHTDIQKHIEEQQRSCTDIQKRREELWKFDPTLTDEFWQGVEREAEDYWLEVRNLTHKEYVMLVYGDEEDTE